MFLLEVVIFVLCIEATTTLFSKSLIFKPLREYLFSNSNKKLYKFLHSLFDCPYCVSVWVSFFYTALFYVYTAFGLHCVFLWFFVAIAAHRAANILHYVIDRVDEYHTMV